MPLFKNLKKTLVASCFALSSLIATENPHYNKPAFIKAVVSTLPKANENLELDQVRDAFSDPHYKAKITYATTLTEEGFEKAAIDTLKSPYKAMIVCYAEPEDAKETLHYALVKEVIGEKVLLQALSQNDNREVWVNSSMLIENMKLLNKDHCPKGYLTISDAMEEQALLAKHSS